jgi:hypothetical protein
LKSNFGKLTRFLSSLSPFNELANNKERMNCSIGNWKHTVLYLTLIVSLLYFIESLISHKLHINYNKIRLKRSPNLPLRFRDDGTFKILQVADMHFGMGMITRCRDVLDSEFEYCSDLNTTRFLRRMIESERPDLIAFTGKNS